MGGDSIPFKRERHSEPNPPAPLVRGIEFQFPSNGKDILNIRFYSWIKFRKAFQFPSNGKDILNQRRQSPTKQYQHNVSIPFKRERHSERLKCVTCLFYLFCVSIPFKRERHSEQTTSCCRALQEWLSFNSLQTGKTF